MLICPFVGVSRLMDLLADSREVIRNDVSTCLETQQKGLEYEKCTCFVVEYEEQLADVTTALPGL